MRGVTLPNTKAYYLAAMIQTVRSGGGKDTDKWKRIGKQNDPYKYAQLIFCQMCKVSQ